MPQRGRKNPYETYRNGQWTLLGMTGITAVNLLLAMLFSSPSPLFFPLSAWLPRELLLQGKGAAGGLAAAFFFGCGVLFLCYAALGILSYRNDRFPAIRAAFLLYAADTAYYFVTFGIPSIVDRGFTPATLIELLFRGFALYQFYRADGVFRDPNRKNPHLQVEEPPAPEPEEDEDDDSNDDEEDEGIQW
ncbi:MAG: hypothetical protein J1E00_07860 [Oscillospiraceae bacterium]|nr:hypothetical protein [Oscillospiraceae bacterium]